jgi:hypothetical protein
VALGIVGDNPDLHEVAKEADQRLAGIGLA